MLQPRWFWGGVAALAAGTNAAAQGEPAAAPLLPSDHWAVRAAFRVEALGAAPGHFSAGRSVRESTVAAALRDAGPTGEAAWARFQQEFPSYATVERSSPWRRVAGAAGYVYDAGRLSPARGFFATREEPRPVAPVDGLRLRASASAAAADWLASHVETTLQEGELRISRWEVVVASDAVRLSAGREEVGLGGGRGGAIVLSPPEPVGRVQMEAGPLALPGVLRPLGRMTGTTFVARMDADRHVQRPWLWGARMALRPHGRLTVGVNRAAIFGGDSTRTDLVHVAGMLVGVLSGDFENQVVSVDGRWRLPTDGVLPTTLYMEWGAEDGAGAWWAQPAWLGGIYLPALPGLPGVGFGVEGARFPACCGHAAWYTHAVFRGNWARGDQVLGHPLGGEGSEVSAYGDAGLGGGPLLLSWRIFFRDRSEVTRLEMGGGNLFTSARAGRSRGGEAEARVRLSPAADVRALVYQDAGAGWRERRVETELLLRLP